MRDVLEHQRLMQEESRIEMKQQAAVTSTILSRSLAAASAPMPGIIAGVPNAAISVDRALTHSKPKNMSVWACRRGHVPGIYEKYDVDIVKGFNTWFNKGVFFDVTFI